MKTLLVSVAGLLLSGCAVTLMPQTAHVPVLLERGAVEARASTGLNGSEGQAAWAVTNHLAVLGGGLYSRRGVSSGEVGAGYYAWPSEQLMLAAYGGAGLGAARNNTTGFEGSRPLALDTRYAYAFAQPTLLWRPTPRWQLGVAWRGSLVRFGRYRRTTTDPITADPIETAADGARQVQHQLLLMTNHHIARRLMLSTRFGVQRPYLAAGLDKPWPLVLNLGLTMQLGRVWQ